MVIISPFEAHTLYEKIKHSQHVSLHLYAPRVNSGYRAIDHLDLYTVSGTRRKTSIPRQWTLQLNLFSGQLYIQSFDEYVKICEMLGLAWEKTANGSVVAADGFIIQQSDGV